MTENPDHIRADIEETRRRLGTNVDAMADKVTPSHVVHRQTEKVKDTVFGVKERVMGVADETADSLHSAGSAVGDVPHNLAARTQGNPLAAGLIAFGAGLLAASLFPPSRKEREAAEALKTAAEPLTEELAGAAKAVAEDLREPARDAVENVKVTATDAVEHVKEEGQAAVDDVKGTTQEATENVRRA